jgi:uncharacterized protein (TIGR02646 family)
MILLPKANLSPAVMASLAKMQAAVNAHKSFREQILACKEDFKGGLTRRCAYCEDSLHDEVEHIAPKDVYPDKAFEWENYLYACGPCNGKHKRAQWKIFPTQGGASIDVSRPANTKLLSHIPFRAPPGKPVFISPRAEDPMRFIHLDLAGGTALFSPRSGLSAEETERAKYTLKILGLNRRPGLPRGRKNAFNCLRDVFANYDVAKIAGSPVSSIEQTQRMNTIKTFGHRTVWLEMVRQKDALGLGKAFLRNPEALTW